MKKIKILLLITALIFALTGCFSTEGLSIGSDVKVVDGIAEGEVGNLFKTAFFDFSVDSVEFVDSYEGYTPAEGAQLVDVVVTFKNTFGEVQPMYNSDFIIIWYGLEDEASEENYNYGVILEESETIMPEEFMQNAGVTDTYHILYEVPVDANEFGLSYLEFFDMNGEVEEGDEFIANFSKNDNTKEVVKSE